MNSATRGSGPAASVSPTGHRALADGLRVRAWRRPAWPAGLAQRAGYAATGLLLPALLLGLWQLAVLRVWLPPQILPAPARVWASLLDLYSSGDLQSALEISLGRVAWSCLIGGGSGLLLGLAMGASRRVCAYLLPTFEVVSQFPVVGWIPLLIIFVGIDEALKISAISLAVVTPVAVNTYKGVANVPHSFLDVARVHGFRLHQVMVRVVLPAALPSLLNGVRQGVMQAWLALVFVELLASSEGIGYLMVWGRQLMQLDLVVVGMIVIGAVGMALDTVLRRLEARLMRWQRGAF